MSSHMKLFPIATKFGTKVEVDECCMMVMTQSKVKVTEVQKF